ncbi:MAG TPA: HD domain-containing protein [Candidatus Saccharimonadales bacterium]|nr:HD domain-containing protein [Candidatus Saccharimonadales bacterium]
METQAELNANKGKLRKPDIKRLIEFHKLLNKFAEIERIIHIKRRDQVILESDAEHTYNLAMMAWFLADYFPELNKNKLIELALVHDLVEIYAGDTYVFAKQEHLDSKQAREDAARRTLIKEWADFPTLHTSIAEYETLKTAEARFVYALDKVIPNLTVLLSDGLTWHEKQVSLKQLDADKRRKVSVSPEIAPYWDALHQLLLKQPHLFPGSAVQTLGAKNDRLKTRPAKRT